ncbi:LysR substrate-binding domain-containing protein [Bradyrhizobium sp. LHD-71]|uniref:LysR family transcriptional regulator n=1 Tax=Bradyrhizobium sp. LHD-71 TaxID=3072141 RepID=UPI00280EE54B|nr:LysR substrate-binding domain-containing protein [Bradyrhizobium sp. LHD-71]MDQ8731783.1 LysR substrate-binding domain-containing protein [Bradyrhizobium sp. LHD-71]
MDAIGEMRAFVTVVEHQSFAGAAAALGLSPSAVSKLVTRLEDRLGVQLLHRTTRRLSLSSEGDVYLARARQILADIAEAEIEVTRSRGAPRGRLRINTSNGFGIHQLAPALPDFIARYPDIEIDLSITDRIVDIGTDPADVIVRAGPVGDVAALSFKIADFERVVCASPAYLAREGTPRTPADLANHVCIVIASQAGRGWPFRTADGIVHRETTRRVAVDNSEAALRLALNGGGIIRLGDMIVAELIANGSLVPLLTDVHYAEPLRLSAVYLEGRHRLPKVRVFLDFLTERFASTPWRVAGLKSPASRPTA